MGFPDKQSSSASLRITDLPQNASDIPGLCYHHHSGNNEQELEYRNQPPTQIFSDSRILAAGRALGIRIGIPALLYIKWNLPPERNYRGSPHVSFYNRKSLIKISNDIVNMLRTDRQADRVRMNFHNPFLS